MTAPVKVILQSEDFNQNNVYFAPCWK